MDDLPLFIEGVSPDEVTVEFLTDLMDVADEHGLSVEGVSVRRFRSDKEI